MFCGNCGTQVSDNAAFCPNCGNVLKKRVGSAVGYNGYRNGGTLGSGLKLQSDTPTILVLIMAFVQILSILVLPLYELKYNTASRGLVKFLGENRKVEDADGAIKLMCILIIASVISCVFFKITQNHKFCMVSAGITVTFSLLLLGIISGEWGAGSEHRSAYKVVGREGILITIICAVVVLIMAFKEYKKQASK